MRRVSLGLFFFHDAYLGARDWDVLALPVLFYTLLGYAALCTLPKAAAGRLLRWSVLPIALLHTVLWIGINADQQRALNRLGNLLQRSGYALHAQAFALGHYHLNLRQALALAPNAAFSQQKDYPLFLAKALHNAGVGRHVSGDHAGAIAAYREASSYGLTTPAPDATWD